MSLTVPVPVPAKSFRLGLVRFVSFVSFRFVSLSALCFCCSDKDGARINVLIVAAGAGGGRRLTLIRRIVHCMCVCVPHTPANHRGDNACNCGDPQAWFRFFRFWL